ncbi:hypothetical protein SpCBS45565_g01465 [Spizellomyces sp. 'palustris']|nr:hypothetical protein SpCBS45565_g01465 [Spizellomyces sp. 'palustris']
MYGILSRLVGAFAPSTTPADAPTRNETTTVDQLVEEWQDILSARSKESYENISHRELFYRLMNIELYPDALYAARDFLQSRLEQALDAAEKDAQNEDPSSSLAAALNDGYCPNTLENYMLKSHQKTMDAFHAYRREWDERIGEGEGIETANRMFPDREFARWWLIQNAPTKLVDGSWLQNVLSPETPSDLRRFALPLYQTFAEELGEGLAVQNHVNVYNVCLSSEGIHLPDASTRAFAYHPDILDSAYERGVVQMALGQFAGNAMFPEAMGYNFGYEQLPLHLLVTTHEFRQMGIDYNYFQLHVTIDNAATGHAHMATKAVIDYLDYIKCTQGEEAMHNHWRRILSGYYLSESNPLKTSLDARRDEHRKKYQQPQPQDQTFETYTQAMRAILEQKSPFAHKIHSPEICLGALPLSTWLDPKHISTRSAALVDELARSRWVTPGNPSESALLKDLCSFGGGMFGVFTKEERKIIEAWIRGLAGQRAQNSETKTCPISNATSTTSNATCPFTSKQFTQSQHPTPTDQEIDESLAAMLALIKTKAPLARKRHGSMSLTDSSGRTRRIDDWFDHPEGLLDALKSSGLVSGEISRLEMSIKKGSGRMGSYFTDRDRGVVERWVRAGAPIPAPASTLPQDEGKDRPEPTSAQIAPAAEVPSTDPIAITLATTVIAHHTQPTFSVPPKPTPFRLPLPPQNLLPPDILYQLLKTTTPLSHHLSYMLLQTPPTLTSTPKTPMTTLPLLLLLPTAPLSKLFSPKAHPKPLQTALLNLHTNLQSLASIIETALKLLNVYEPYDLDTGYTHLANYVLAVGNVGIGRMDDVISCTRFMVEDLLPVFIGFVPNVGNLKQMQCGKVLGEINESWREVKRVWGKEVTRGVIGDVWKSSG